MILKDTLRPWCPSLNTSCPNLWHSDIKPLPKYSTNSAMYPRVSDEHRAESHWTVSPCQRIFTARLIVVGPFVPAYAHQDQRLGHLYHRRCVGDQLGSLSGAERGDMGDEIHD